MYLAAATALATYAAHETPAFLGFMALLFCWMAWKRERLLLMASVVVFALAVFVLQDMRAQDSFDYSQPFAGQLDFGSQYTIDGDGLKGFAELEDGTKVYARYKIQSAEEKAALEANLYKTILQVDGLFEVPSPPPHRYAFDMETYLKRNGVSKILAIEKMAGASEKQSFLSSLNGQRESLKTHIRETFPDSLVAEAEALLIGEQEKMTMDEQQIYQTLGITHLFAISGLHVEIAAGLLYFLLVRLHIRKESVLVLMLVALPLYAVLAGGAPSVWRSVWMVCAVLGCRLFKIRLPISQILLISFVCFLLWNPYSLYNIGFQLSYGATFAIIYSARFLSRDSSNIKIGFVITFISQLTLYPLLIFHFYEISLSAFFVNSVFVPLYTLVILPVNFLLLVCTWVFQPAADLLFGLYEPLRTFVGDAMAWIASLPYQMWNPGKPAAWLVVVLMASVWLFYSWAERGFKWRQLLIIILPAAAITLPSYFDPALKVVFLDVGQGDSALIELPYRKGVYLIDSGGLLRFDAEEFRRRERPYEIGRQVVAPYLKGRGISSIDKMILSHADADHAEAAEEIFQRFRVKELHLTPGSEQTDLMQELMPFTKEAEIFYPGSGSVWQVQETGFAYLAPDDAEYVGNDDSLVLLMANGPFRVLFTGDLEENGEGKLLKDYGGQIKDMTVLKVGHHGSKTSSSEAFLNVVAPSLSIFSSGAENRYGHPSKEVVERFRKLQLETLNTAERGTIEMAVQNGNVEIRTMR
ncbi:DNA internalization-related competence protein ComEC/Rec2 [Planococcus sp. YIM B11945]|uniref:DNA internalization-related competence protein ComEC/Rec2 n=1 Tax=Planococcus sp. YIM B11945 TaxID=3435410 RepID=UPI003D7E406E